MKDQLLILEWQIYESHLGSYMDYRVLNQLLIDLVYSNIFFSFGGNFTYISTTKLYKLSYSSHIVVRFLVLVTTMVTKVDHSNYRSNDRSNHRGYYDGYYDRY